MRFYLHWVSTPEERYDSDMNNRAIALAEAAPDVEFIGAEGGSGLDYADNDVIVQTQTIEEGIVFADRLAPVVGHVVELQQPSTGHVIHEAHP